MKSTKQSPKWWQLYLTFPFLFVLFAMDGRLKLSSRGHQIVQIGIILLVYGVIYIWLRVNARALSGMDQQQYGGTFRVIKILPYQMSATQNGEQPILQLPDSEIKGVLSDTFEMDCIDAEFLPVKSISKETK